ncbi:unnamed protein product [Cuscuta epithymum]|uniref:Nucleocapsid protein n=1 Tax=Cuscuta epithymum TaxID=186058 RepID=A0AAV0EM06_9ASTE|nr:unnamed protein product [Cuscuta epithymum]
MNPSNTISGYTNDLDVSDFRTHEAFAGLDNINPALYGTPEKDWIDTDIHLIKMWHNAHMGDADILAIGNTWHAQLNAENSISSRTAIRGLKLAMSLKSMYPNKTAPLLFLPGRGQEPHEGAPAAVSLPDVETFDDTPFAIQTRQVVRGPDVPLLPNAVVATANLGIPAREDIDRVKIWSYTFLASYLMKLMVKSPENVVRGLENMKARYASFYGPSRTIARFSFPIRKACAYKKALLSQSNILTTYTMALAHTQSYVAAEMNVKEKGLLSYLGYIPFSYTGLHAYSLIINLKNISNVGLGELLSMLHCNIMRPALMKVHKIVTELERTVDHPDRPTYFRYCATWGDHYFLSLRSSRCPHLCYTVACAWKTIAPAARNENCDPEKIMATTRLAEPMKRTLKRAGELLAESLRKNIS